MITMKNFGRNGRLGNQLFQYAAMIGISKIINTEIVLPHWKYSNYFEEPYQTGVCGGVLCEEDFFHYDESFIKETTYKHRRNGKVDLTGYFQSEKYFKHEEDLVRKILTFSRKLNSDTKRSHQYLFEKPVIAMHVRRGDYVNNSNYEVLPVGYYIQALEKFDLEKHNVLILSDDIEWCKVHFKCMKGFFFSEGRSDIEDLCLMSQCDHFIIANSSFSWWGAWLGKNKNKRVIRSAHHFKGELFKTCNIKDFYPEEWEVIDWKATKVDLTDVTFTIPVQYDHKDRKKNLDLCVCMLQHHFNTNVMVMENGANVLSHMKEFTNYKMSDHRYFHRTKMLNDMAKMANTKFIANWDSDVFIPPMQIYMAVKALRQGAHFAYPYDGKFARMPRETWFDKVKSQLDIGVVGATKFKGMYEVDQTSVGGAVIFDKTSFISGGMENENFVSFGPEDSERYWRFTKLGFQCERIKGPLYHMNHFVGSNSSNKHAHVKSNREEWGKVHSMSIAELAEYVATFSWLKNK